LLFRLSFRRKLLLSFEFGINTVHLPLNESLLWIPILGEVGVLLVPPFLSFLSLDDVDKGEEDANEEDLYFWWSDSEMILDKTASCFFG